MNQPTMQIALTRRTVFQISAVALFGIGAAMVVVGLFFGPSTVDLVETKGASEGMKMFLNMMAQPARAAAGGALIVSGFLCLILGTLLDIRDSQRTQTNTEQ